MSVSIWSCRPVDEPKNKVALSAYPRSCTGRPPTGNLTPVLPHAVFHIYINIHIFVPVASFILLLSTQSWNMECHIPGVTWHPLNTTLTYRLEACQRFAARVILQSWNLSHDDLLQTSDLPLLSKRRDYTTLCHLYKILHHLSSSPNPYNPHPRPSLRNLNSRAIVPLFCRLTLCQKSFYPYAPTLSSLRTLSSTILCSLLTLK